MTLAPPNDPHRNVHCLLAVLAFALAPRAMLAPVLVAVAGARCRQPSPAISVCLHQVPCLVVKITSSSAAAVVLLSTPQSTFPAVMMSHVDRTCQHRHGSVDLAGGID